MTPIDKHHLDTVLYQLETMYKSSHPLVGVYYRHNAVRTVKRIIDIPMYYQLRLVACHNLHQYLNNPCPEATLLHKALYEL